MKRYIYISFMILMGMVSSCVVPFDPEYDEEPVIFVESYPGASSGYIDILILPAYSKSNTSLAIPFKPEIKFVVNGTTVPVEGIDTDEGWYRAIYSPQPEDRMSISVVSNGFRSVYAETVIPPVFPDRKIDYREVESGIDSYDNVLFVTLSDMNPHYAYGVQICNETLYDYPDGPERWEYRYSGILYPDNMNFNEMMPVLLEAMDIDLYGGSLWAWDGKSLKKGENTFSIKPDTYGYADLSAYDSFFVEEGMRMIYDDHGNEIGEIAYTDRNRLLLYTMSEEFYKYRVANEFQADYSGFVGFVAPSNYCYSNIDNGAGAFAGISIVETDWITKEFIENNR